MTNPLLRIEGLEAGYHGTRVLHQVDLELLRGEICIVLGGSGCGKSTLLNNVLGLEKPWGGRIHFFGQEYSLRSEPLPVEVRQRTGVLFQNGALLSSMTVAENVAFPLRCHRPHLPAAVVQELVAQKLASVQMLHAWHRLPSELSGGMRKRAALARALALDPDILFCDEPSAGLDPLTSRSLDELLLRLREEFALSILIITHELDSIRALAGKLVFLSQGRVLFAGTLPEAEQSGIAEVVSFLARRPEQSAVQSTRSPFIIEDHDHGI